MLTTGCGIFFTSMMSSKRVGLFSLCFVICWILILLYIAWPMLIQSEEANLLLLSVSHYNNPSAVYIKSGTTISPDRCNSCVRYHQYKALIYPQHIPDTYLDMVVFIPSQQSDDSFQRRQFLRKKILNSTHFPQVKIRHVFVFGTCKNCNQTKLQEEAQLYDDIVVFDFLDTYMNLTIKTIVSLNWVFNSYKTDLFLKVDDDVLLNVTDVYLTILRHLHYQTYSHNYILGDCISGKSPRRNLLHKWGVSKEAYPNLTYPRYCTGLIYAITRSAVSLLLNQTYNTPLIHLEDVSVGILAQRAENIKLIDIPNWRVDRNWINDLLVDYRKYHTINTGQGRIQEVEDLWKKFYT